MTIREAQPAEPAEQAAGGYDRSAVAELLAWAEGLGAGPEDLDELIHEAFSKPATAINNDGLESQIEFLVKTYGAADARELIEESCPDAARCSGDGQSP